MQVEGFSLKQILRFNLVNGLVDKVGEQLVLRIV